MPLTFKEFRELVAPYAGRAGKCPQDAEVATFARQVMENLLYTGSAAGLRKVCVTAYNGCLALPPEVEVPLKVKIDGNVGTLWNKWFSFHSLAAGDRFDDCPSLHDVLVEDGAVTPLANELSRSGDYVGVLATATEDADKTVLIQGTDSTGTEVFLPFKGESFPGEKFNLVYNTISYGTVQWGRITGVVKPKTNGYVLLFAVDPLTQARRFLAQWGPLEEKPMYRRYRLLRQCAGATSITMLCRVKLRDNYHDDDLTLFDSMNAVVFAAQRLNSERNNDIATAQYKASVVTNTLEAEAGYKKISGSPLDVFTPLSAGAIRNVLRRRW